MSEDTTIKNLEIPFTERVSYLLPGESKNLLLVQTVSQSGENHTFYLINLHEAKVINKLIPLDEYVNLAVKSFNHDRLVVVSFSKQQNPDLINVLVFDWNNPIPIHSFQNTKMTNFNSQYIEIDHPMIQNKTVQIDLKTGSETKGKIIQATNFESNKYPSSYSEDSEYFDWFVQVLKPMNFQIQKQCEFLKINDLLFISFYIDDKGTLSNHLVILDSNGNLIKNTLLASNLTGIGKDTFFVIENRVIFVTDKNILHVLEI